MFCLFTDLVADIFYWTQLQGWGFSSDQRKAPALMEEAWVDG